ncbi:MAG: sterol desaturase family protein [Candidatus Rokubacteria bacterium]|nr:sterol desaturase family protein [Candidatus Rokubacteria bacterium]
MANLVVALSACAGFALFFLYANLFEYAFHRWVLHRPSRMLPYSYEMHALLHHRVFRGDATYHVQRYEDRDLILFQWWQAPLILAVHAPAVWGVQAASGFPLFWGGMTALAVYYGLYESLHWCMHNPTGRWIERTRVFHYLDAHHRLHHRLWRLNFNVVLPIGDLVFGTFRPLTSPSKFS